MTIASFTARLEGHRSVPTIVCAGTVDREAEPALFAAWEQARTLPAGRLLFDFTDVTYINSTGIAVVVGLLARARADRRPLGLFGLSDHYRHVFEITRLSDFMEIYGDAEAARAAASASNPRA